MVLLALTVLMAALVLSLWRPQASLQTPEARTRRVLSAARQGLIAYASQAHSSGVQMQRLRVGELPCPDTDGDGIINPTIDYSGSDCRSYVGWLPWRTLGLAAGRDGSGARLWYALAPAWANRAGGAEAELNPAQTDRVWLDGEQAVAWLLAPRAMLSSQSRNIASDSSAQWAQYLEWSSLATRQWQRQPNSNDSARALTSQALLYSAERNALLAVARWLNQFYQEQHRYPDAAAAAGEVCQVAQLSGAVPSACPATQPLPWPDSEAMDAWVLRNQWLDHIQYQKLSNGHALASGPQYGIELHSGAVVDRGALP